LLGTMHRFYYILIGILLFVSCGPSQYTVIPPRNQQFDKKEVLNQVNSKPIPFHYMRLPESHFSINPKNDEPYFTIVSYDAVRKAYYYSVYDFNTGKALKSTKVNRDGYYVLNSGNFMYSISDVDFEFTWL